MLEQVLLHFGMIISMMVESVEVVDDVARLDRT